MSGAEQSRAAFVAGRNDLICQRAQMRSSAAIAILDHIHALRGLRQIINLAIKQRDMPTGIPKRLGHGAAKTPRRAKDQNFTRHTITYLPCSLARCAILL
jgi:hypothetical protein